MYRSHDLTGEQVYQNTHIISIYSRWLSLRVSIFRAIKWTTSNEFFSGNAITAAVKLSQHDPAWPLKMPSKMTSLDIKRNECNKGE